jgi:acetyl-CoA C-acetyltransferase
MSHPPAECIPVIVAIGEITDRPAEPSAAREPVALMADALRAADQDAGGTVLNALDSVDLVGQISWRYRDPVRLLCGTLQIQPARAVNASMGGEIPLRSIHEAALRIAAGQSRVAAIVGGEAFNALGKARKAGVELPWTPQVSAAEAVRLEVMSLTIAPAAARAGATEPTPVYAMYENALQAALGQTPETGRREAARLWAQYAAVAADNPGAWIRSAPSSDEIATPSQDNRLVSFPYPKLMVANPSVNQSAAVIVASLAWARANGIREDRLVHIWGGAAAQEPDDFLRRDGYAHSTAQTAVLERAVDIAGGDASRLDLAELYSCFPVVPKLALRALGLRAGVAPTVAGGLTFFGGPLNNYMAHAVCAMVRKLRARAGSLGLLYAQGGLVSKHHALIVGAAAPSVPIERGYSVQGAADARRGPVPELLERYSGAATVETHTVMFDQSGAVRRGIVIARTPANQRVIAQVRREDETSVQLLTRTELSAVGEPGHIRVDAFDNLVWESGPLRHRKGRRNQFCSVEPGRVTIVTIDRPHSMNALHPAANEELAEIFDDFQSDPEQWVAIITGAGEKAFCAGNDLKYTAEAAARGDPTTVPRSGFGGLTSRWDLTKPVIAAVNGVAMGGGFEIALACDLIIASQDAVFALPEAKVGLAAVGGGLLRLPRQIGMKQAMGMILTGRRVTAAEGRSLGFVNEVVAPEALMPAARRWAAQIIECSPMSVRASKETVARGLDEADLRAAYERQLRHPAMCALLQSEDFHEGPLAFSQKRAPQWKGR